MYNIYYIILSFITVILTYVIQNKMKKNNDEIIITPNLKTKVTTLKKKFNIKSSETTFKNKKSIQKNRIKTINKINNIDIVPLPLNSSSTNLTITKLPEIFINSIKNKFNKSKIDTITNFDFIFKNVLKSFINSKIIYQKIFEHNGNSLIDKIDNFISIYKKIVSTKDKYKGYNIVIKLYNDNHSNNNHSNNNHSNDPDEKYIIMKKNTLIKINNTHAYKNIFSILEKDKIFILNNSDDYYVGYGNIFNSNINPEQIKDIFFNKVNLSDEKIKNNYEMFCKFKKITLIYWINTPIYFS